MRNFVGSRLNLIILNQKIPDNLRSPSVTWFNFVQCGKFNTNGSNINAQRGSIKKEFWYPFIVRAGNFWTFVFVSHKFEWDYNGQIFNLNMITFSDQCRLYFNKYYLNNTIECMFYKYEHYNLIIWHKLLFLSLTIFYVNFTLCFQIKTDCYAVQLVFVAIPVQMFPNFFLETLTFDMS